MLDDAVRSLAMVALLLVAGCGAETPDNRGCDPPCRSPKRCDADSGRCVDKAGSIALGERCTADVQCQSGLCFDRGGGAICEAGCVVASDCAEQQVCVPRVGTRAGSTRALTLMCDAMSTGERFDGEACADDAECTNGLCQAGRCTVPCKQSCATDGVRCESRQLARGGVELSSSLCVDPGLRIVELGPVDTPASGAVAVSFEIEADDRAFVLVAEDEDNSRVAVTRLEGPDGALLVNSATPDAALVKSAPYIGSATVIVPGSDLPKARIKPGSYEVTVGTHDPKEFGELKPTDGRIERLYLAFAPPGQPGLIDLHIHLSPGTGLSAEKVADDPYLKTALARLTQLLRQMLGVTLGSVEYFDLLAEHDNIDSGDKARALVNARATGGEQARAANLFIVKKLSFAAGFAGGGVAPPRLYNRPASGVVLRKESSANTMGVLMAHELLHFLGLWHTTELTGGQDKIDDTPVCPDGTEISKCPDFRNLMFPRFPTTGTLALTAGQRLVALGAPLLYQITYRNVCGAGVSAVDISDSRFASGTTEVVKVAREGSCGGASGAERIHLYRLERSVKTLEITARGLDGFVPALYVRRGSCADDAPEAGCAVADEGVAQIELADPAPADYWIVVDGEQSAAGRYSLLVKEISES